MRQPPASPPGRGPRPSSLLVQATGTKKNQHRTSRRKITVPCRSQRRSPSLLARRSRHACPGQAPDAPASRWPVPVVGADPLHECSYVTVGGADPAAASGLRRGGRATTTDAACLSLACASACQRPHQHKHPHHRQDTSPRPRPRQCASTPAHLCDTRFFSPFFLSFISFFVLLLILTTGCDAVCLFASIFDLQFRFQPTVVLIDINIVAVPRLRAATRLPPFRPCGSPRPTTPTQTPPPRPSHGPDTRPRWPRPSSPSPR